MAARRCLLLLLIPATCWSSPVVVGKTTLEIPNPPGFVAITPQMTALRDMQRQFVAPMNEQLFAYIPEHAVQSALANNIPDLTRSFSVQTLKALSGKPVSKRDFAEFQHVMRTQSDEMRRKVERDIPGYMAKVNKNLTEQFDRDLALTISQIFPLPPHEETDRTLAYSSFVKLSVADELGNPLPHIVSETATVVLVKGKVLFFYSFAEEAGLQWSREASKQWVDSTIAANPPNVQSSIIEALPSKLTGLDWRMIIGKGLAAALVVLIMGAVGWRLKRFKSH